MDVNTMDEGQLDCAVAKLQGWKGGSMDYCSDWGRGGPIIERERIDLLNMGEFGWQAFVNPYASEHYCLTAQEGPTPLIAAMRAYVASKQKS